ncbi:hypothetical protein QTH90_10685 [Variovorax sp. J2P1-59]|uniref:hypothetical protein n=1 Tax=Variovorax flavidus TaxID=3053501 RepID=UPI0025779F7B|nr:hypothetical protein [Variovorax sp. J2P1-59]MDM0074848.1 hypothetical protein [Variovorax sp. J2P1-59]
MPISYACEGRFGRHHPMIDIPFEDQLLTFKTRLQHGLDSALELLNDRTGFRYTALHRFHVGALIPVCVFDRFGENRAYLQSALLLNELGNLTLANGEFVSSDCSQDGRLEAHISPIISYCGLVLMPMDGPACGVLSHFAMDRCEMKPCEIAFMRAVSPLLVNFVD